MTIAIGCRCGKLKGELDVKGVATRAICYCKDCQAYARFLSNPPEFLDPAGGSDIAPASPAAVRFTQGVEHLACMSLSDKGIYRWYASCCRTPIGNTPRTAKVPYVGVPRAALTVPDEVVDAQLGRADTVLNTESARSPVTPTPARFIWEGAKIAKMIAGARLSGRYKTNPFFDPVSGKPVREPQVLSPAQRAALA